MEERTFSLCMVLVAVIVFKGFIYLMERIDKRFMKEEQK